MLVEGESVIDLSFVPNLVVIAVRWSLVHNLELNDKRQRRQMGNVLETDKFGFPPIGRCETEVVHCRDTAVQLLTNDPVPGTV